MFNEHNDNHYISYNKLKPFKNKNIKFIQVDSVNHIDHKEQTIQIDDNDRKISYDKLVICTGVKIDQSRYINNCNYMTNRDDVRNFGQQIQNPKLESGTIVISALCPYKCPPAPYEYTWLVENYIKTNKIRDNFNIIVTTEGPKTVPGPNPLPFLNELKIEVLNFYQILKLIPMIQKIKLLLLKMVIKLTMMYPL